MNCEEPYSIPVGSVENGAKAVTMCIARTSAKSQLVMIGRRACKRLLADRRRIVMV